MRSVKRLTMILLGFVALIQDILSHYRAMVDERRRAAE